ncbi:MAG TPA: methyltransferase domain-containing protein [Bryobacteraceae bacterium]|nr:methyltransferase domain-containing protein [Bryobacteraceae bacterium]
MGWKLYLASGLALSAVLTFGQEHAAHADHMEHHFDPKASAKAFDDPSRDAWQMPDRVIATLNLKPGESVADIGAGTGYFTVRLAKSKAAPMVYAADIEPGMVNYIRDRAAKEGLHNVVPVLAAADTPNLPKPVDLVLIVDTYHHIGDREVYFRQLAKSLKPGGRVAIIDFKPDSPEGPPPQFRFPLEKFKTEMAAAGYTLADQYDFLPRQRFLIFQLAH